MSTMSTGTALVAHDHTLGNDSKLLSHMCVLAIARGHGTPFDATSVQEEDIVELCVKVGQAHPKDVLWFLVTESIIAFQSSREMLAVVHMVTKATPWQEAPVKLQMSPPSTLLRAYIAGRNACPSGTQSLTPEGEEVPRSPPRNLQPNGRAPPNSTWPSRTLGCPIMAVDRRPPARGST